MHGWMDVFMYGWMYVRMDVCMDACMDVCVYGCKYIAIFACPSDGELLILHLNAIFSCEIIALEQTTLSTMFSAAFFTLVNGLKQMRINCLA